MSPNKGKSRDWQNEELILPEPEIRSKANPIKRLTRRAAEPVSFEVFELAPEADAAMQASENETDDAINRELAEERRSRRRVRS